MQGSHSIESNTCDNHTTISKRNNKNITAKNPKNPKPLIKLKPQITLISHTTDNEAGHKITIISSCKHTLNKHKANKPSYHSGANNPNEQNKHTAHKNLTSLVTLITLN